MGVTSQTEPFLTVEIDLDLADEAKQTIPAMRRIDLILLFLCAGNENGKALEPVRREYFRFAD